jgi:protein ImuB
MFACIHAPGNLPLLVECARHFSPFIEETSADTVVFDIRGLRLIFGAPEHIAAEIQARVGLPANIAVASNPDAAVHAARGFKGVTIIPQGREAAALAPLPLVLLGGSPEFAQTLDAWGVRIFGEFATLPCAGVAARLGQEGVRLQRLARGEGRRLPQWRGEPLEFREIRELDTPVDLLEPLLAWLSQMLQNLCGRLRAQTLAASELHLRLELEQAPHSLTRTTHSLCAFHEIHLHLPIGIRDEKVFLKLLQLDLSQRPPEAAVEKIHLELHPVEPRAVQHGLFLPSSPQPERLEITLARIRNLVGAGNVGVPELLDTYRPDSFRMTRMEGGLQPPHLCKTGFSLAGLKSRASQAKACATILPNPTVTGLKLALRRFRPPCSAQVWCSNHRPVRISSSKIVGRITASGGPWRTSGDWWTGDPWDRIEWDVEAASGGIWRIYQDSRTALWRVEGSYD